MEGLCVISGSQACKNRLLVRDGEGGVKPLVASGKQKVNQVAGVEGAVEGQMPDTDGARRDQAQP